MAGAEQLQEVAGVGGAADAVERFGVKSSLSSWILKFFPGQRNKT